MKKIERAIMWTGATVALFFCVTQTALALIRGDWFVAFCFAVMLPISKGMMQALDTEERKEANDDGDAA
jgi:hypothetical protein